MISTVSHQKLYCMTSSVGPSGWRQLWVVPFVPYLYMFVCCHRVVQHQEHQVISNMVSVTLLRCLFLPMSFSLLRYSTKIALSAICMAQRIVSSPFVSYSPHKASKMDYWIAGWVLYFFPPSPFGKSHNSLSWLHWVREVYTLLIIVRVAHYLSILLEVFSKSVRLAFTWGVKLSLVSRSIFYTMTKRGYNLMSFTLQGGCT